MPPKLTLLTSLFLASFDALHAAELRFAGTLGNSDDSQPVFAGKLAAGIGPVLDDEGALWERGGSTRLLASFEIPEGEERGNDELRRVAICSCLDWEKDSTPCPSRRRRG